MPPLVFSPSEALSLVMAVLDGHHPAHDATDPVGAAVGKLLEALPRSVAGPARAMRQHARVAPDRDAARPSPTVTAAVVDALADGRSVRVAYTTGSGTSLKIELDPWAVVVRHGLWYLLCHARHVDDVRTYRIDRMAWVEQLSTPSRPPAGLDPIDLLERRLGSGWTYRTHVVFDAPPGEVARHVIGPMGTLSAIDGATRTELMGTTDNPTMYASEWLARIPLPFTIVGGAELEQAVAEVARRMAEAVSARSGSTADAE